MSREIFKIVFFADDQSAALISILDNNLYYKNLALFAQRLFVPLPLLSKRLPTLPSKLSG
jgi:hypothetical protein